MEANIQAATVFQTERVITIKKSQGRVTKWLIDCPDKCSETEEVKPITRHKAARFAFDHLNIKHDGEGSVRVGK